MSRSRRDARELERVEEFRRRNHWDALIERAKRKRVDAKVAAFRKQCEAEEGLEPETHFAMYR